MLDILCESSAGQGIHMKFQILFSLKNKMHYTFTLTMLWANLADDNFMTFFLFFPRKKGSGTSCKLSSKEKVCMKCQILFPRKNKKKEKIFQSVICWNFYPACKVLECHLLMLLWRIIELQGSSKEINPDIFIIFWKNKISRKLKITLQVIFQNNWYKFSSRSTCICIHIS